MNPEACEDAESSQDDIEADPCANVDGDPRDIDGGAEEEVPLFFFMDCEASSGVPYQDDIVEIAVRCWPYKCNVEDSLFYHLIHTSKYLCKFALQHGFTKKLLRNKSSFKVVMNKLFDWLKKTTTNASRYLNVAVFPVLLCHGGEAFDYLMMFSQLERTGISFQRLEEINLHFADTYPHLNMYQMANHPLLVGCGSLGIGNLQEKWFGPQSDTGFHRANVDVEAMVRLFTLTPLYSFLQDIPMYSTADWIDYYEEKKNQYKIKRELEDNLPSSISGIQRKFHIKKLLQNDLGMENLRALYMECTEPHHFRQELVDLGIKGTNASKLKMYFFNQQLKQSGTKEYVVKIKENMQRQEWTTRTNTRGRKFQRRVANVLPPVIPSGGSGFDFDDATGLSQAEQLKELMQSFAKFQLQMISEPAACEERRTWVIPPEFWNNIAVEPEKKYTIDEDKNLPMWEESELDWQCDDFKRSPAPLLPKTKHRGPLLPTPTTPPAPLLPTPEDSGEAEHRLQIPWNEIRREYIKAKQDKLKQNGFKHGWGNMTFTNMTYGKRKTSKWKERPQTTDCYEQWYESPDSASRGRSVKSGRRPDSCGRTAQPINGHVPRNTNERIRSSGGHATQANCGRHALQVNCIHVARVGNGHVSQVSHVSQGNCAQPNYRKYGKQNHPRNGMRQNWWCHNNNQSGSRNEVDQSESLQGARRKTYFKSQRQGKQNNQRDNDDWCTTTDGYSEESDEVKQSGSSGSRESQRK